MTPDSLQKPLSEPYAFALLIWPVVIALISQPEWPLWARIVLGVWLVVMQLGAYNRGAGLGNAMLLASGIVALAVYYPVSAWTLLALPALLITLSAAQRIALKRAYARDHTKAE